MSGDPYIKENERLEAEIARLRAALEEIAKGNNHYGQLSLREIASKAISNFKEDKLNSDKS